MPVQHIALILHVQVLLSELFWLKYVHIILVHFKLLLLFLGLVKLKEVRRSLLRGLLDVLLFENEVVALQQTVIENIFLFFVACLSLVVSILDFDFLMFEIIVLFFKFLNFLNIGCNLETLLLWKLWWVNVRVVHHSWRLSCLKITQSLFKYALFPCRGSDRLLRTRRLRRNWHS